jgi:serine/threonine-protein kinase
VEILAIVGDGEDIFLVSEYVVGKTLRTLIDENGGLGFPGALAALRGIAPAVDYAHERQVVHGDLDPAAVLVSEEGEIKVMDFSVAPLAKEVASRGALADAPGLAPEQRLGVMMRQADVFALAVCFYELLCGGLPFEGSQAQRMAHKREGRHVPISRRRAGELPEGLGEVFAKALDPEPERRYGSADELLAAVERLSALG